MLRTALVLSGAGLAGHMACNTATAWVGTTAQLRSPGQGLVQRRADELWISDVSPKGKAVVEVYEKLKDVKDPNEVKEVMDGLEPDQKLMLKGLLEAKSGQDRPITTTDPEVGDTVPRLYKKFKMLEDDDDRVLAWRAKMEYSMLKDIQTLIEKDQMVLADEEAAKELADDAEAEAVWQDWKAKFPKAAENGSYQGTPTRREDIMYRFRRMKETMGIDSETAMEIVTNDGTPMVVDPLFVRRTWNKMVQCVGKEEALNDIVLRHPGALIVQAANVEQKINEIKMGSAVIGAFASVGRMFR